MSSAAYSLALVFLFIGAVTLIPDLPPGSGLIIGLLCAVLIRLSAAQRTLDEKPRDQECDCKRQEEGSQP